MWTIAKWERREKGSGSLFRFVRTKKAPGAFFTQAILGLIGRPGFIFWLHIRPLSGTVAGFQEGVYVARR